MGKDPVVSIVGGTIWGNRGAESMLTTTIGMIRRDFPQAKFFVFSYLPKKDRELVNDEDITILSGKPASLVLRHFPSALIAAFLKIFKMKVPASGYFKVAHALEGSDLLLDIGGITFSDGREKYLPFNILTIWPAMLLGVPVVKLAQAVGPFKHFLNRICAKLFLVPCQYVFARGEKTAEFLADLGYPAEKYDTVADTAFLYEPVFSLSNENEARVADLLDKVKKSRKKLIVLSPSILVETQSVKKGLDYACKFFDVINKLDLKKYHFVFMPNATCEGSEKTHNNDLLTLGRMRAQAESGGLSSEAMAAVDWVLFDVNTASVRNIISKADVLVTSRYHAMISGLSLAVPTVVIGWSHKYKETMDYFGLGRYAMDFSNPEMDLPLVVKEVLADKAEIHKQIRKNLYAIRQRSMIQFTYIKKVLS